MPFWKKKEQESESNDYTILYMTNFHYLRVRLKHSTNQIDFVLNDRIQYTDDSASIPNVFKMINEKPEIEGWCPVCQPKHSGCYLRLILKMKGGNSRLFWEHTNVPRHDDYRGCGQTFRVMTIEERNQNRNANCEGCIHFEERGYDHSSREYKGWCKHLSINPLKAGQMSHKGLTKCSGFRNKSNWSDSQHPTQSQINQWLAAVPRVQPRTERTTTKTKRMHCSGCGRELSKGQDYCPHCGSKKVGHAPHCKSCGARIPRGGRYCAKCGTEQ